MGAEKILKNLSLSLYGLNVRITLKPGSDTCKNYGNILEGRLIERKWGNKVFFDATSKIENYEEIIISLTIKNGEKAIKVPCEDIESLKSLLFCNLRNH